MDTVGAELVKVPDEVETQLRLLPRDKLKVWYHNNARTKPYDWRDILYKDRVVVTFRLEWVFGDFKLFDVKV